ncbi:MAG: hypothetical protein NTW78_05290 [Campylobacterales bacterium]|nr:hypothetical protein [Campylobacterales bacterium]
MRIIQLQLHLAKRSTKKICVPRSALAEIELHINHSLSSLNHLIENLNDYKTTADSKQSAKHPRKEAPYEND